MAVAVIICKSEDFGKDERPKKLLEKAANAGLYIYIYPTTTTPLWEANPDNALLAPRYPSPTLPPSFLCLQFRGLGPCAQPRASRDKNYRYNSFNINSFSDGARADGSPLPLPAHHSHDTPTGPPQSAGAKARVACRANPTRMSTCLPRPRL